MNRWLRRIAIGLGALLGLVVLAGLTIYLLSVRKLERTYTIAADPVTIPSDSAAIAQGRHLTQILGCTACHGDNLGGRVMADVPAVRLVSANLTTGKGGRAVVFTPADWSRAVRHGVGRTGKPLLVMPSDAYAHLSDADLGAIVAFIKSVPPVDTTLPAMRLGPMVHFAIGTGRFQLAAERINHDVARPAAPPPGVTLAYGHYLTRVCTACHGDDLTGQKAGGEGPAPADLTRGGPMATWSEADFIRALRTGKRPDASELSEAMPWKVVGKMTDDELRAMWLYVRSLPPKVSTH